jgi:hypothetical protein
MDSPTETPAAGADEPGLRVVLPRRRAQPGRAIVLLVAALLFGGVPTAMVAGVFLGVPVEGDLPGAVGLVLFCLPFQAVALLALAGAVRAVSSGCTVELTPEELRVVDRIGPLSWTRRRDASALRDIALDEHRPPRGGGGPWHERWGLRATFRGSPRLRFARGYERARLAEVAEHLQTAASGWGRDLEARGSLEVQELRTTEPGAPGRLPSPAGDATLPDLEDLPVGGDILLRRDAAGLVVLVPPAGVRGSHGLVWIGGGFVVMGLFGTLVGLGSGDASLKSLFGLPFAALGAGLFLAGWNLSRRRSRLTVGAEELVLEHDGPLGRRVRRVPLASVEDVRVGPSGVRINDRPVMEVQVHADGRKAIGLLAQREEAECEAVAAALYDEVFGPRQGAGPA